MKLMLLFVLMLIPHAVAAGMPVRKPLPKVSIDSFVARGCSVRACI